MSLKRLILALIVLVVAGGLGFWIITIPQRVSVVATEPYRAPDLANGRTMFLAGGCAACHAVPKQDDSTRLGGGRAIKTAFGTFYAPNISSDPKDGIGGWSEGDFVTALTKGTSPTGEHYFPVFPYPSYQNMRVDDVRDLFAYLKTLPAVAGRVRDHDIRFPFGFRRLIGGWKLLFLAREAYRPDPAQSPAWQRGAYLVNGPGHCAECHSPRHPLGGVVASMRFAGGPDPEGGDGWVPNITQAKLADWSVKDISYMLATGDMPDGDSVGGSMVEVIKNLAQLPAADRDAIATYVKSLSPVTGPPPPKKKKSE
ncbi:MAG TPA: cytochrome c [Xanthobacteraceae bacterium]|nr:cytochrome c [Xanthobacteraceae bacterium]